MLQKNSISVGVYSDSRKPRAHSRHSPTMDDDSIDRIASDVADGIDIDWDSVLADSAADQTRQRLAALQQIHAIARAHAAGGTEDTEPSSEDDAVSGESPAGNWGRYALLEVVGSGSYGAVYRARDPQLEFDLAIKILHPHVAHDRLKGRLLHEGRALASVKHPNVVRVLGVESHNERVGLCMEFVQGETLESVVRSLGPMNAREALLVGEDVCRALSAVHRAGLLHRDVKARNIMREQGGRILLMDFGTGTQIEGVQGNHAEQLVGTPLYMAPEVLAGGPPQAASDIYGVGVLLYFLVTGSYPVAGTSIESIKAAHMQGRRIALFERRTDLPLAFTQVVERALDPNPRMRYQSAAAMLDGLVRVEHETAKPEPRLRKWLVGAAAAVPAACLLLGSINSRYFNVTLARSEFANESLQDWLTWGARSAVAPTVVLVGVFAIIASANVIRRALVASSQLLRRAEQRALERARRWRVDDPAVLAMVALAVSAVVLGAVWWRFVPFLSALVAVGDISTAPIERVGFLSPALRPLHDSYRASFTGVVITCVVVWSPVLAMMFAQRTRPDFVVLAGGVAVLILTALLLDFPYRLISWDQRNFEQATWRGRDCYVLGERGGDVLVFCPTLQAPRNRIVSKSSSELERTGTRVDIFSTIPPPPVCDECRFGIFCRRTTQCADR